MGMIAVLLFLAAGPAGAAPGPASAASGPASAAHRPASGCGWEVEQIQPPPRPDVAIITDNVQRGAADKPADTTTMAQLPPDSEAKSDEHGPEGDLVEPQAAPGERLYDEVARVWTMIRRRGLQPTPELIAREIGPDAVARFLDQYPGAAAIFGHDSDQFPLDRMPAQPGPSGGAD